MVTGARNSQIAAQLVISEATVKFHVANICHKLGAEHRAGAVSRYLQLRAEEHG
jgi:DNA-binding NarL/FixJ family response regulator